MKIYKIAQESSYEMEFLSTFKPQSLVGLASEALKCENFEDFESDYLGDIKHGTYWHVTDNPNFSIDLSTGPRDMSSMAISKVGVGSLMVTSDLTHWADYYGGSRGYAAEIDLNGLNRDEYKQISRGFGNEFYINDASKVKVKQVLPIKNALKIDAYRNSKNPNSQEELKRFYNQVHDKYKEFIAFKNINVSMSISNKIKTSERVGGKTLSEKGVDHIVAIYRAVNSNVQFFKNMDYVTLNKEFALEHAEHMMWTEEEDQHVIKALVAPQYVAEAYNPGEYFYIGQQKNGHSVKEFNFKEYANS
jgi:hypothetical protein